MTELMQVVFTFAIWGVDIVSALLCYYGLTSKKKKKKSWFLPFFGAHVLMLLSTLFLTYIPGKFGLEFSLFDAESGLVYKNGAIYQNIGLTLFAQCLAYIILILKDIWAALRKKAKLNGKLFLLCLIYTVIVGAGAVYLLGDTLN